MQLLESDVTTKEVLSWNGVHLIHFQGSACSQKTRIFLNLKGIDWRSHHLDLSAQKNYEPWFLGINPRGLVPVLIHDGAVHIESNDILDYLEQSFPQPALIPANQHGEIIAALRDENDLHMDLRTLTMRFVIPRFLAQKKSEAMRRYAEDSGSVLGDHDLQKPIELAFWRDYAEHGITDSQVKLSAQAFKKAYTKLEAQLQHSQFLTGDDLTLLDIAWFIYTERLISAGYPFEKLHPNVLNWYQVLAARSEFSKEVVSPAPLRFVTAFLHAIQRLRGRTLERTAEL